MHPLILPVIGSIVPPLFFYKDGFSIKQPMKVDVPLNKTKSWCEYQIDMTYLDIVTLFFKLYTCIYLNFYFQN